MLSTAGDASALVVTALLIIGPLALIGVFLAFVRMWPWRNVFYSAWLAAVVLAVVLPIAIPAAIWPPSYYDDASGSGDCASIAKDYAADGMPPMVLYPVSVRVEDCAGRLSDPGTRMLVHLKARGPYGITFATARVTETDIRHFSEDGGGELLGMLALTAGVVAVSLPFVLVLLSGHIRRMRLSTA